MSERIVTLPTLSERDLQSAVIDLAHVLGWKCAHFRPAMNATGQWRTAVAGDGKGFPDLVLIRDRVIFAELKATDGKLSPEQEAWAAGLSCAGAEFVIWRPIHWYDGTIEAELRKVAVGYRMAREEEG